jgi:hypothetical protein
VLGGGDGSVGLLARRRRRRGGGVRGARVSGGLGLAGLRLRAQSLDAVAGAPDGDLQRKREGERRGDGEKEKSSQVSNIISGWWREGGVRVETHYSPSSGRGS